MNKTDKIVKKIDYYKIKSYKKQLNSEIFDIDKELNFSDTGDVQIDCQIGKFENIFSPFDIAKDKTISDEFSDYLMGEAEIVPIRHELEIRLHVEQGFTEDEEKQIQKALKRYFSFSITSTNVKLNHDVRHAAILYALGIFSLAINILSSFLTSVIFTILPIAEMSSLAVWFCIWEASGVAVLERNALKLKRFNMLRLYNAKITVIRDIACAEPLACVQMPNVPVIGTKPAISVVNKK